VICHNPFDESVCNNARSSLGNRYPRITEELLQLNTDHKMCDKYHKKISNLKCDASNKQKDDDSDSDKIELFATLMQISP
jgi:hypothetical protein